MNVTTKFDLGEMIYHLNRTSIKSFEDCPACDTKGWITIKGHKYNCPGCDGQGRIKEKDIMEWTVKGPVEIVRIDIELRSDRTIDHRYRFDHTIDHRYRFDYPDPGFTWAEGNVFRTEQEAQAECDRRNNEHYSPAE